MVISLPQLQVSTTLEEYQIKNSQSIFQIKHMEV